MCLQYCSVACLLLHKEEIYDSLTAFIKTSIYTGANTLGTVHSSAAPSQLFHLLLGFVLARDVQRANSNWHGLSVKHARIFGRTDWKLLEISYLLLYKENTKLHLQIQVKEDTLASSPFKSVINHAFIYQSTCCCLKTQHFYFSTAMNKNQLRLKLAEMVTTYKKIDVPKH